MKCIKIANVKEVPCHEIQPYSDYLIQPLTRTQFSTVIEVVHSFRLSKFTDSAERLNRTVKTILFEVRVKSGNSELKQS